MDKKLSFDKIKLDYKDFGEEIGQDITPTKVGNTKTDKKPVGSVRTDMRFHPGE